MMGLFELEGFGESPSRKAKNLLEALDEDEKPSGLMGWLLGSVEGHDPRTLQITDVPGEYVAPDGKIVRSQPGLPQIYLQGIEQFHRGVNPRTGQPATSPYDRVDAVAGLVRDHALPGALASMWRDIALRPKYWNPATGQGPLSTKDVNSFRSGSYAEKRALAPFDLFRVHGGEADEIGSFFTRTPPTGPVQSIIDSALFGEWGNAADRVTRYRIPSDTKYFEGIAGPQGGLVGGGNQVYIPRVEIDPSWIVR